MRPAPLSQSLFILVTKMRSFPVGIAGVVLGGVLGAAYVSLCESSDCNYAGFTIGSALLGGAVGAGVGALIGAAIPGWKRIGPHD